MTDLTTAYRERDAACAELKQLRENTERQDALLRGKISGYNQRIKAATEGLNTDKIALAKTIVYVRGSYAKAGEERGTALVRAIEQFTSGKPIRQGYEDLWCTYFGTKDYDRWHGQYSPHTYGYGPSHGSIIFQIGVLDGVRKARKQEDLTPEEIEAVVYYLTVLERVQAIEAQAKKEAEAQ